MGPLSEEQVHQLKKIFAIANINHTGIIGRRQFKDLMFLLGIDPTDEELDEMLLEMDENGDGQIEFEEFAVAMVKTYDAQLLKEASETPLGAMGTRAWARGEILWSANNNLIVIAVGVLIVGLKEFQFVLIPLTLAYFMTFLLVPIMNLFEQRPLKFRGKSCCRPKPNELRELAPDSAKLACFDLRTNFKFPHGVALLITLAVFFGVLGLLFNKLATDMATFLNDPKIISNMDEVQDSFDQWLNDSDIIIIEPPICENTCEWPEVCDCPTHATLNDKNLCRYAPTGPSHNAHFKI